MQTMKLTLTRRRSQPVLFLCLLLSGGKASAFTVPHVRGSSSAVLPSSSTRPPSISVRGAPTTTETKQAAETTDTETTSAKKDLVSDFCIATNEFFKGLVIQPVRDYVEIQPAGTAKSDILSKLTAPPEVPGIPRPVWLTILGSVPTALGT